MPLRADQHAGLARAHVHFSEGRRFVLLVQPTGTGKTYTACHFMNQAPGRGMFIVHREVLLEQTSKRLAEHGIEHGVLYGKRKANLDARIIVASAQTLVRRPHLLRDLNWAVPDEAHRGEHAKVLEALRTTNVHSVLGLTATPQRGQGGLAHEYDAMVVGLGYPEAVAGGLILPPRIYAPMRPNRSGLRVRAGEFVEADAELLMHRLMADAMKEWQKFCSDKRTLAFCVNVKHANETADAIRALGGISYVITGDTPGDQRTEILQAWTTGPKSTLCNVAVFAEGYDAPECEAILNLAPMRSTPRWLQSTGRGCRTFPGKTHYLLVDCTGSVFDHGSPAAPREWSLAEGEVRAARKASTIHTCSKCFAAYEGPRCELCGAVPERKQDIKTTVGEMREVSANLAPSGDVVGKKGKDDEKLEMSDLTMLRRKLYATLSREFREPLLTVRVKESMTRRVPLRFERGTLMVPAHIQLLW